MTNWETKPAWGKTRCLIDTPHYSKHELFVEAGGTCSVHYHNNRANTFIIGTAKIAIVEFMAWKIERNILEPDDEYEIPSLIVHQFQVLESGTVFEEYWSDRSNDVPVRNNDIVRLIQGERVPLALMENHAETLMLRLDK